MSKGTVVQNGTGHLVDKNAGILLFLLLIAFAQYLLHIHEVLSN